MIKTIDSHLLRLRRSVRAMMRLLVYFVVIGSFLALRNAYGLSPAAPGFLEGHLKIAVSRGVHLADDTAPQNRVNYADYPLLVLSKGGRNEVARINAEDDGHYRVALPPGQYLLEIKMRAGSRVGTQSVAFTIVSQEIARVDMQVDAVLSASKAP